MACDYRRSSLPGISVTAPAHNNGFQAGQLQYFSQPFSSEIVRKGSRD